ncbi:MAG: ABC transporter permease [Clostridia bacterium]|nr:ABC transporter permease [Clostridia bacterium]
MLKNLKAGLWMLLENIVMSVSNILHNRMRSFLTILGILIGVTAVIALITTISGVASSLSDSFSSMGAGSLTVSITGNDLKSGLGDEDFDTITAIEGVDGTTPSVSRRSRVSKGSIYERNITITGQNAYYFQRTPEVVARGRALNILDTDNMNFVCLISEEMVETFFYGVDPVGEMIYIDGMEFLVVGILSEDGDSSVSSMMSGGTDIIIPYSTALKLDNTTDVTSFTVYLTDANLQEQVESSLESVLDAMFSYEEDTYTITNMDALQETMDSMMSMMSGLLGGIASISLLVGGIGIMNMMLTSVTERTGEIGMKKALGARPGQIQAQFLIESFILSVTGGLIGVILGIILSISLCNLMGTTFVISYGAIALGVGFSAGVGIVFGWTPARKASKLNPIDALRSV